MATLIDYALMAGVSYISTRADINKFPIPASVGRMSVALSEMDSLNT